MWCLQESAENWVNHPQNNVLLQRTHCDVVNTCAIRPNNAQRRGISCGDAVKENYWFHCAQNDKYKTRCLRQSKGDFAVANVAVVFLLPNTVIVILVDQMVVGCSVGSTGWKIIRGYVVRGACEVLQATRWATIVPVPTCILGDFNVPRSWDRGGWANAKTGLLAGSIIHIQNHYNTGLLR